MAFLRGKSLVLVAALVAAPAYVLVHRARSFAEGEGRLADGSTRRLELASPGLRHVVWDMPEALSGSSSGAGGEERPALSRDGRWLVFASGERGLNCELYQCELVGGVPGEPRRIAALDGPADELAPSFSAQFLYFASDRPGGAGGLDLYRARFHDGGFDAPERLDAALQSAADDLDPAATSDDGELVFASARDGELRLWQAQLDTNGAAATAPVRLDALATGEEEREPAFARDGRALTFAQRTDGRFELAQSEFARGTWQTPRPLALPADGSERRGPSLAADGFELVFARRTSGEAFHLARAGSIELSTIPPIAWTWFDSAVVGSLLVLALAAALALRWTGLGLAYKCVLASVIAHLVLLFLLRYVLIGGGEVPAGDGGEPLAPQATPDFHMTMRAAPSSGRERAGSLEGGSGFAESAVPAAPVSFTPLDAPAAAPEAAGLAARSETAEPSAPERGSFADAPAGSNVITSVALDAPADAHSVHAAATPALELAPSAAPASGRASAPAQPGRAHFSPGASSPAPSAGTALVQAPANDPVAPERGDGLVGLSPASSGATSSVALAAPSHEANARRGAVAPEFALGSAELALPAPAGVSGPGRASFAPASGSAPVSPGDAKGSALVQAPASEAVAPGRGADASGSPTAGPATSFTTEVALAAPSGEAAVHRGATTSAPGLELGDAAGTSTLASSGTNSGPARAALAGVEGQAKQGGLAPGPWSLGSSAGGTTDESLPARAGGAGAPAPLASAPRVELADHEAPTPRGGTGNGTGAPDLVSDLGQGNGGNAQSEASAPRALRFDDAHERARPSESASPSLARVPDSTESTPRVERQSWDHTPYENRSGEQKARALKLFGGDERTEEAVARGLGYLARIQQPGGNWGRLAVADNKYGQVAVGKTGLCLLAFLGAGHTQNSGTQYSTHVARAVEALLALQDPASGHFGDCDAYGHGIATYALAEDLALTGEPRIRAALELAVRHILEQQNDARDARLFGGWSYYYPDGHAFDRWPRTAITSWQIMALESARLSGIAVPDAVFDAARKFLENARDDETGSWRYNHDPQRLASEYSTLPASTPAAMFALSLMGADLASEGFAAPRSFVLERRPSGYRYTSDDDFVARGTGNLYFWYYGTLSMFRAGGESWKQWNEALKRTLLPAQARDGSWTPIDTYARYARDSAEDKSYTSAMCVLSLEIYYRYYLPLLRVR